MENDELLGRLDERFKNLKEHIDFRFSEQDTKILFNYKEQKDKNEILFDFMNNKAVTLKQLGIASGAITLFIASIGFLLEKIK